MAGSSFFLEAFKTISIIYTNTDRQVSSPSTRTRASTRAKPSKDLCAPVDDDILHAQKHLLQGRTLLTQVPEASTIRDMRIPVSLSVSPVIREIESTSAKGRRR
jgi:hypothetical protein